MEELEEEINPQKFEDFKVPDINPAKTERRIHCLKTIVFFLLAILIIIVIIIIIFSIRKKGYVQINCKFLAGNETVQLINEKAVKNL